ncbi:MAG: serine/threonine-protein kinase [Vicinamibacterales bacterium]
MSSSPLTPTCPACHAAVEADHVYCAYCGSRLRPTEGAPASGPHDDTVAAPPDAERTGLSDAGDGAVPPPDPRPRSAEEAASQHMRPGDRFGPRYRITRLLGIGGMGAVYQAWDSELSVDVAIKTIRPGVGTDAHSALDAERRFKRELLLARKVTHPNVVRIYDLGEIDRTKYITMSFVDGEDLASVLGREGILPLARALDIMRQVTAGMGAAHAAGIVHRDLKPANIMVDESGHALVMDFGIARALDGPAPEPTPAAGTAAAATPAIPVAPHLTSSTSMVTRALTMAGSVMGTLDYMAPEQARGEPVDQRADVYALGLILRDLILGRTARPRSGDSVQDLRARLEAPLAPARSLDAKFPEALDAVLTRSLALDPAERYPNAQELFDALDALDDEGVPKPVPKARSPWFTAAAAVAVVASGIGAWYVGQWVAAPPVEHDPVAVLIADVQNTTGDAAFDGTLEPVLKLALENAGFISAYDRSSIPRSLGVPAPEVLDETAARELAVKQGVGVVVSGSLSRSGDRYSVSLKAAESVTGNTIVSDDESASGQDAVLGVVTRLADEVRESLGDDASDTAQRFAMETLSATSLDVVRERRRDAGPVAQPIQRSVGGVRTRRRPRFAVRARVRRHGDCLRQPRASAGRREAT